MKIENEKYEICFVERGGEILSFTNKKTGLQYMYQGDSKYWSGKNPTLFPIVGSTFSKSYEAKGKVYSMKNHGIIRYADLKCIENDKTKITFLLESSEETLQVYPYKFRYEVTYELNADTLNISYSITNKDDEMMPFGFGLHPAFRVPLNENEKFEDYVVEFEREEKLKQIIFDPKKQKDVIYKDVTMKKWNINYDEIEERETLVFSNILSKYVILKGPQGNGVKVTCEGYPYLAFWTAERNAPFLCIEPWYSHDDYEDVQVPFKDREGTIQLDPGNVFKTSYAINVF